MPEFILPTAGQVDCSGPACICHARTWGQVPEFAQGYIEALFFTSTEPSTTRESHSREDASEGRISELPGDYGFADLAPETLDSILKDCAAFETAAADLLAQAYERPGYDEQAAGRDFFYTRAGHGVGYWDRDELAADGLGDKLSKAVESVRGGCDVILGDDGRVYVG